MEYLATLGALISNLNSSEHLKKFYYLSVPIWIVYNLFPETYTSIKTVFFIESYPIWLPEIIALTLVGLILLAYTFLIGLAILFITWIIQNLIRAIFKFFGSFSNSQNELRERLSNFFTSYFFNIVACIISLAIFSEFLIDFDLPMKMLYETSAYWVSVAPYNFLIFAYLFLLIFPKKLPT